MMMMMIMMMVMMMMILLAGADAVNNTSKTDWIGLDGMGWMVSGWGEV